MAHARTAGWRRAEAQRYQPRLFKTTASLLDGTVLGFSPAACGSRVCVPTQAAPLAASSRVTASKDLPPLAQSIMHGANQCLRHRHEGAICVPIDKGSGGRPIGIAVPCFPRRERPLSRL